MSLAQLENVPQTADEKHWFDFNHQDLHRRMIEFLVPITTNLDAWVMDPFDVTNQTAVLQHQVMHNELDALLHTPNYDMTTLNWADADSRGNWVSNNYSSHQNYAQITGVD
jgi:hypothetical protein